MSLKAVWLEAVVQNGFNSFKAFRFGSKNFTDFNFVSKPTVRVLGTTAGQLVQKWFYIGRTK